MRVRTTSEADTVAIDLLLERSYPVLMRNSYDAETLAIALPLMVRSNPALLQSGTYHLAEEAGHVVGCGGWTRERPGGGEIVPGLAHLRHFAADPAFTRRGVGRAIFQECVRQAHSAGVTRWMVFPSLNAEPFYRAMGLQAANRLTIAMTESVSFPVVVMEGRVSEG